MTNLLQYKADKEGPPSGSRVSQNCSAACRQTSPAGSQSLPPHYNGGVNREEDDITNDVGGFAPEFDVTDDNVMKDGTAVDSDAKGDCLADVVKYGVYHTPKQFLSRALQVQHPMDSTDHLESVTKSAPLDFIFQYPAHVVKLERKKNLLQAKPLSVQLAGAERELHQALFCKGSGG